MAAFIAHEERNTARIVKRPRFYVFNFSAPTLKTKRLFLNPNPLESRKNQQRFSS